MIGVEPVGKIHTAAAGYCLSILSNYLRSRSAAVVSPVLACYIQYISVCFIGSIYFAVKHNSSDIVRVYVVLTDILLVVDIACIVADVYIGFIYLKCRACNIGPSIVVGFVDIYLYSIVARIDNAAYYLTVLIVCDMYIALSEFRCDISVDRAFGRSNFIRDMPCLRIVHLRARLTYLYIGNRLSDLEVYHKVASRNIGVGHIDCYLILTYRVDTVDYRIIALASPAPSIRECVLTYVILFAAGNDVARLVEIVHRNLNAVSDLLLPRAGSHRSGELLARRQSVSVERRVDAGYELRRFNGNTRLGVGAGEVYQLDVVAYFIVGGNRPCPSVEYSIFAYGSGIAVISTLALVAYADQIANIVLELRVLTSSFHRRDIVSDRHLVEVESRTELSLVLLCAVAYQFKPILGRSDYVLNQPGRGIVSDFVAGICHANIILTGIIDIVSCYSDGASPIREVLERKVGSQHIFIAVAVRILELLIVLAVYSDHIAAVLAGYSVEVMVGISLERSVRRAVIVVICQSVRLCYRECGVIERNSCAAACMMVDILLAAVAVLVKDNLSCLTVISALRVVNFDIYLILARKCEIEYILIRSGLRLYTQLTAGIVVLYRFILLEHAVDRITVSVIALRQIPCPAIKSCVYILFAVVFDKVTYIDSDGAELVIVSACDGYYLVIDIPVAALFVNHVFTVNTDDAVVLLLDISCSGYGHYALLDGVYAEICARINDIICVDIIDEVAVIDLIDMQHDVVIAGLSDNARYRRISDLIRIVLIIVHYSRSSVTAAALLIEIERSVDFRAGISDRLSLIGTCKQSDKDVVGTLRITVVILLSRRDIDCNLIRTVNSIRPVSVHSIVQIRIVVVYVITAVKRKPYGIIACVNSIVSFLERKDDYLIISNGYTACNARLKSYFGMLRQSVVYISVRRSSNRDIVEYVVSCYLRRIDRKSNISKRSVCKIICARYGDGNCIFAGIEYLRKFSACLLGPNRADCNSQRAVHICIVRFTVVECEM